MDRHISTSVGYTRYRITEIPTTKDFFHWPLVFFLNKVSKSSIGIEKINKKKGDNRSPYAFMKKSCDSSPKIIQEMHSQDHNLFGDSPMKPKAYIGF